MNRKRIKQIISVLQHRNVSIDVEWAFGRPRCVNLEGDTYLSPRLPAAQMVWWLDGFVSALDLHKEGQ